MPEISHQQADALRALEWLLSEETEDRRSGRSMTMAIAYLRLACARRNREWLHVFDHFVSYRDARVVMGYIEEFARNAHLQIVTNHTGNSFRLQGTVSVEAEHYLFDEFIETDIRMGLSEEQLEEQRLRDQPEEGSRRPPHGTIRQVLSKYVHDHPGLSATQIARALDVKPSTVSSYLFKETKLGNLVSKQHTGPRGGTTYYPLPPPEPPVVGPSVWERLRKPEVG